MSGVFEQLLEEQKKTNQLLTRLIAMSGAADSVAELFQAVEPIGNVDKALVPKAKAKVADEKNQEEVTRSMMMDLLMLLKSNFGIKSAREVLDKHGFAKMIEVPDSEINEVYLSAKESMRKLEGK